MASGGTNRAGGRGRDRAALRRGVYSGILGNEFARARARISATEDRARAGAPASSPDFVSWSLAVPTARGEPLDFKRYPFQREIYEVFADTAIKDAVVMKGTQLGISELLLRLGLYYADIHGETALYVFATAKQLRDISDTRVDALLRHSPYLRQRAGGPWNKDLKQLGNGYCFFRGSQAKADLIAVDAALLLLDEYDDLNPENIPEAEQRVGASELALIRRVGVPSDPEYGIAQLYGDSDEREWHVRCGACAELQPLRFAENIRCDEDNDGLITNPCVVCRTCKQPLDVTTGRWIPAHPGRPRPGFHVHRLLVPGANLLPLVSASKQHRPHLVKSFHNNGLGLPYSERDGGLDRPAIAAAIAAAESYNGGPMPMVAGYNGPNLVTAGIDVASTRALHVRISEHLDPLTAPRHRKRCLYVGTVADFEELARIIPRYNVRLAVIDAAPEWRSAQTLADAFPGRVFLARYATNQLDPIGIDRDRRVATVRRVVVIDAMVEMMLSLRNLLPADLPRDYVDHLVAPRRRVYKDEYDRHKVTYVSSGPDDYFHAETYDLVATLLVATLESADALREHDWEPVPIADELGVEPSDAADLYSMRYDPGPPESYEGFD